MYKNKWAKLLLRGAEVICRRKNVPPPLATSISSPPLTISTSFLHILWPRGVGNGVQVEVVVVVVVVAVVESVTLLLLVLSCVSFSLLTFCVFCFVVVAFTISPRPMHIYCKIYYAYNCCCWRFLWLFLASNKRGYYTHAMQPEEAIKNDMLPWLFGYKTHCNRSAKDLSKRDRGKLGSI